MQKPLQESLAMPLGLTPAEVLSINHFVAKSHGLMPMQPRDPFLLEMICARAVISNQDDLCTRVGLLVEGLLNARPLGNCHHASALAAMIAALDLGKHHLSCSTITVAREVESWNHPVFADDVTRWLRLVVEPVV